MDIRFSIAIPSKNRAERLNKFFLAHYRKDLSFVVCIFESEMDDYRFVMDRYGDKSGVNWIFVPDSTKLGGQRDILAKYSLERGDKYVLFSDDNANWNPDKLTEFIYVINKYSGEVKWLGAWLSLYGLFTRGNSHHYGNEDLIKSKLANIVFAVETSIFKDLDFDSNISFMEDADLKLRVVDKFWPVYPIYVYRNFVCTKRRHEAGGCADGKMKGIPQRDINYLNKKYSYIVNDIASINSKGNLRMKWKKYFNALGDGNILKK